MRFGIGYDLHRLVATKDPSEILIGGVAIPSTLKVEAHSDGDVLLHACVDAMLGALALGDIGRWFPDTDNTNKGRPSREFVQEVLTEVDRLGWVVKQFDSIIHLETPRLSGHIDQIRENIARLLNIELSCTSVKAKSAEGLGPIGTRKAVAANVSIVLAER